MCYSKRKPVMINIILLLWRGVCLSKCHRMHNMDYQCPLQWRHNGQDGVSNHQPHDCLLNRLFKRRSKKTSNLRATGLCAGNSLRTGEFPAQRASNAKKFSIWWRHHALICMSKCPQTTQETSKPVVRLNSLVFKFILAIDGWDISHEISSRWMSLDLTDDKSTLVQVMAWCRQATSHYLSQCWPRSLSPYGVTRPQWV